MHDGQRSLAEPGTQMEIIGLLLAGQFMRIHPSPGREKGMGLLDFGIGDASSSCATRLLSFFSPAKRTPPFAGTVNDHQTEAATIAFARVILLCNVAQSFFRLRPAASGVRCIFGCKGKSESNK
jgi:hypothetical protein